MPPPKSRKAAQSSVAQEMLAAKGTPESLESFLGGFVAGGGGGQSQAEHEQEGAIAMNLKLLNKSSEVTKQKALGELISRIGEAREETLIQFVPSIAESIIRHAQYNHVAVRAAMFTMLTALMERGKSVKLALAPSLPSLAGVWVMAMNDMESTVRLEARASFEAAFSADKRPAMLAKYTDDILRTLFDLIVEVVDEDGKVLQDDALDKRANALFSALRALGFLVKQVSASQPAILAFVVEKPTFAKVLPTREPKKGYIAAKTPLVRSAGIALLRDVVTVCPSQKVHPIIAQALHGAIFDTDPTIASRVWELLLLWCRANGSEAVSFFPKGFLDDIVDTFMNCDQADLAEVIFPCLFPLLTQLSKDIRCGELLDEFCGALVEKLQLLQGTPNVSAHEVEVILGSLMECWELHCVRRKGTSTASDSEELFTVIMTNLSVLLQAEAKCKRYEAVVVTALVKSLLKTSLRNESCFRNCIAVLCELPDAPFRALPDSPEESLVRSFHHLQATTAGALHRIASREVSYTRQMPMYTRLLSSYVKLLLEHDRLQDLAEVLSSSQNAFTPTPEVMTEVVQRLTAEMERRQTAASAHGSAVESSTAGPAPSPDVYITLLGVALMWKDAPGVAQLMSTSKLVTAEAVQTALRDHFLQDPAKVVEMLIASCETAAFDDIRRCLKQLAETSHALSPEEKTSVLNGVVAALRATLRLVNPPVEEAASTTSSSSSTTTSENDADSAGGEKKKGKHQEDVSAGTSSSSSPSENDESSEDAGSSSLEGDHSHSASSEAPEEEVQNEAEEVLYQLVEWCELLTPNCPSGTLWKTLDLDGAQFAAQLAPQLFCVITAVAPRLYPEHYMSIKALRSALTRPPTTTAADDDAAAEPTDVLAEEMEAKVHYLKVDDFNLLVARVEELLRSYQVSNTVRDDYARRVMARLVHEHDPDALGKNEAEEAKSGLPLNACALATQHLHHLVPFASPAFLHHMATSPEMWNGVVVAKKATPTVSQQAALAIFDGYFPLGALEPSMTSVVRSAQLLRLLDTCDAVAAVRRGSTSIEVPLCTVPQLFRYLLQAASVTEVFSDSVCNVLYDKLLPAVFTAVTTAEQAATLAELIMATSEPPMLLCTLAAVHRRMADGLVLRHMEGVNGFVESAQLMISATTSRVVDTLFTPSGARGISAPPATLFSTYYAVMDDTANVLRRSMLASLPKAQESLLQEASCMLPSWDWLTAKLTLVVLRHLASMPIVADSTANALIEFAQKQNPLHGLELLAELSCARVMDLNLFSNLVRVIVNSLCRCYTLQHLPSNGRLTVQPPNRPVSPMPLDHLRRIAGAAVLARRGVIIHSRMDDVLRSTVNLIVFDTVCEAISRLRGTKGEEALLLAKLIAFTSEFMSELLTSDVAVLRASEASVRKIASVVCFAYLWVNTAPIARLESIGLDTVAGVLRSACLLGNLTLMRSSVALHEAMRAVTTKLSLKPVRDSFSSSEPAKLARFRRQNTLITKTQKQKLSLFPYLLAWCVYLTTPPTPEEAASSAGRSKQRRVEVYALLDLLCALLLTPTERHARRLEDTYLAAAASQAVGDGSAAVGSLGFEVVALTRTDAPDSMDQLARGAAAVFALLLRGPTLDLTKQWMETVESKLRTLFVNFVERHISPMLIQEALLAVLSHSPDGENTFNVNDNFQVSVRAAAKSVDLHYEMEDAKMDVRITFPVGFPLCKPTVEYSSGKDCGVSTEQWRGWMLKMTVLLFDGSANIWDCVELFSRNLDAHFSGQEPCPICFAVVSSVTHKLPDMRCSVCHNSAFHSGCLYTWWANGGQNVCPLCRAPWVSE